MYLHTTILQITGKLEQEILNLVFKAVLAFIGALITAFFAFFKWCIKTLKNYVTEYKEAREKEEAANKLKFEAINTYINETDKVQMLHSNNISDIKDRTKALETKSEKHGRLLTEHKVKIDNLEKDA